jgi:hypothetical protein
MICIEAGSSNPYLVCNFIHLILCIGSINEAGLSQWIEFFYHCKSEQCFIFFLFQLMGVSYKEREFIYSKFQRIINSRRVPSRSNFLRTCRGGARYLAIAQNSLKYYELKRKTIHIIIAMGMY